MTPCSTCHARDVGYKGDPAISDIDLLNDHHFAAPSSKDLADASGLSHQDCKGSHLTPCSTCHARDVGYLGAQHKEVELSSDDELREQGQPHGTTLFIPRSIAEHQLTIS